MKQGERYLHFKGNHYIYMGIALPLVISSRSLNELFKQAILADDGKTIIPIYEENGVWFTPLDEPVVLYYNEELPNKWWARKVDDFFGYKEHDDGRLEKRFVRITEGSE